MPKRMKFQRKASRVGRKTPADSVIITPDLPFEVPPVQDVAVALSPADKHRQRITGFIKKMDFGRGRAEAKAAIKGGHLTLEEASNIIDEALPNEEEMARLPTHHALAVALLAGPNRHTDYSHIASKHLSGLSSDVLEEMGINDAQGE